MDISLAAQAKSDQLNAIDIIGELVITIRQVDFDRNRQQQKLWLYFDGDNGRPWKPSVGMCRMLMEGWGTESDNFMGKSVKIWNNPAVIYAGKAAGGIQILAMSHIQEGGFNKKLLINRTKSETLHIDLLDMARPVYPDEQFNAALPKMAAAMESGKMTLQHVISHCQKTGDLTAAQLEALQNAEPIHDEERE